MDEPDIAGDNAANYPQEDKYNGVFVKQCICRLLCTRLVCF